MKIQNKSQEGVKAKEDRIKRGGKIKKKSKKKKEEDNQVKEEKRKKKKEKKKITLKIQEHS